MRFILYLTVSVISCVKSQTVYDVTHFGADPTGVNKSSDAIKRAINEANSNGGGIVLFPDGKYSCGPIHLKSNIILDLSNNSVLNFTTDFDDYLPMVRMRWEGTVLNSLSPLIYAYKQQNITIRGKGLIDGQGVYWYNVWTRLREEYTKTKKRDTKYQKEFIRANNLTEIADETTDMSRINVGFLRPPFIQPFESKNILIEGITVRNSPFWNINPVFCENITIRSVRIEAPYTLINTDGIDLDSSKDVLISDVEIDVGDDCIAIKSGRDLQGRRFGRPTENVVIRNSKMFRGVSGVAIGSEQSGGVKNISVSDCVFNGTDRGFYIKSTRGRGGVVHDIHYKNISMINMKHQIILVTMTYAKGDNKPEPFSDKTPVFRDIKFEDIKGNVGDSHYSIEMAGLPESLLQNFEIKNMEIISENGIISNFTTNFKLKNYSQTSP